MSKNAMMRELEDNPQNGLSKFMLLYADKVRKAQQEARSDDAIEMTDRMISSDHVSAFRKDPKLDGTNCPKLCMMEKSATRVVDEMSTARRHTILLSIKEDGK